MKYIALLLIFIYGASCVPPVEQGDLDIKIDLTTDSHQEIVNSADRRDISAISNYLTSEDVTNRFLAVSACSNIKSDSLHPFLINILNTDLSEEVRMTAAYALGQQADQKLLTPLVTSFQHQDTSRYNTPVRGAILEAIGKCGDAKTLQLISTVNTYSDDDHHLLLGQARAIYRFGRRNIYSESGTGVMLNNLRRSNRNEPTRIIAAQYLSRHSDLNLGEEAIELAAILQSEQNVYVRMALAGALTRLGRPEISPAIISVLTSDPDYRVRCNILRHLGSYPYNVYRNEVIRLLDDQNAHIFNLASELLLKSAPRQDAGFFLDKSRTTPEQIRKPKLLAIALNSLPSRFINTRRNICNELVNGLAEVSNEYAKAEYLRALSLDPLNIDVLIREGLSSANHMLRATAISSTNDLLTNPRTRTVYQRPSAYSGFRELIVSEFTRILQNGDPGSVAAVASVVQNEDCGFKNVVGFNLGIRSAMRTLQMPHDYSAKKEANAALEFLEDTTYSLSLPRYNHPIEWSNINDLNDSSRAYIITVKGQIEIKLFKNHAPGTVANFVSLAQSNYYDGKSVHRVVPNFVIQCGSSRNDGYGSTGYTIRSELGQKYFDSEGYLGMASAGKDTEDTQWFITHSPTPHLDGDYTIFGKVTSGMDVVHRIEKGDKIQDIRILKY